MTRCEQCPGPGWCERHQVVKSPHWVKLCQTREDYFRAWEEGRGPGQQKPDVNAKPAVRKPGKNGWGDKVETFLQGLGITPERYVDIKEKFGLPPTCNCAGRKEWLNQVGRWWNGEK